MQGKWAKSMDKKPYRALQCAQKMSESSYRPYICKSLMGIELMLTYHLSHRSRHQTVYRQAFCHSVAYLRAADIDKRSM